MYSWEEIVFRLFLASVFSALIVLERERKDWTAGMSTRMMVKSWLCVNNDSINIWIFGRIRTEKYCT